MWILYCILLHFTVCSHRRIATLWKGRVKSWPQEWRPRIPPKVENHFQKVNNLVTWDKSVFGTDQKLSKCLPEIITLVSLTNILVCYIYVWRKIICGSYDKWGSYNWPLGDSFLCFPNYKILFALFKPRSFRIQPWSVNATQKCSVAQNGITTLLP